MALRDSLLPVFESTRELMDNLGLRTNALTIEVRTWPGPPGARGTSATTTATRAITPPPRVRTLSTHDVASSGGRYEDGDLRADKITPKWASGGYEPAELRPTVTKNQEVVYVITGPNAGDYHLIDLGTDRNFGYSLVLRKQRNTP